MEQLYPPRIKSMRNGSARLNEEGMKPRCLHELEQYSTLKREEIALEMQGRMKLTKLGPRSSTQAVKKTKSFK